VALNVAVNPRAEFPTTGLRSLVVDRVHQRVQGYLDRAPPEDLVMGASRADFVAGLPGREAVTANFAVAGSTPEDWRDLYAFVRRHQEPPRNLVLIVDQSSFTDVFSPRVPSSNDAGRVTGRSTSLYAEVSRAVRTLSLDYVGDSLHSLQLAYVTGYPPERFTGPDPAFARQSLLAEYRNGTFRPADVHPDIDRQSERAFGPGSKPVPAHRAALDTLIQRATADGVTVWAVMPSYQPVALVDLETRFPAFTQRTQEVREALAAWCPRIHATDATNATRMGIDPAEFYDQSHPTTTGSAQMMAAAVAGRGNLCA
jgi:hypothetical protein